MPRQRNPVGIAAGKLILAIQKEQESSTDENEVAMTRRIVDRAHTLLQASRTSSVSNLLDGRTVHEYLGVEWIEMHPSVKASIDVFASEVRNEDR
jgi:hypothetical protein